jgi:hypothetical protein
VTDSETTLSIKQSIWRSEVALLVYIATVTVVAHVLTGARYGFHRDELATLDDARHLAWGYVAYPPVTPFFGRLSLMLFGTSLPGFRFFAALADAVAVLLTGLMARELGGGTGRGPVLPRRWHTDAIRVVRLPMVGAYGFSARAVVQVG